MELKCFTFNPFQENTYILWDEQDNCLIIDPGCFTNTEQQELLSFIKDKNLKPLAILHTHAHVDHIMGTAFLQSHYGIDTYVNKKDLVWYESAEISGERWGIKVEQPEAPSHFIPEIGDLSFGQMKLEIRFIPGHAPGHVVFIHHESKQIIAGDVLFLNSIGRTDLPFCDHDALINGIHEQLFPLDDDYMVHPGHGPSTSIGNERKNNPFLR